MRRLRTESPQTNSGQRPANSGPLGPGFKSWAPVQFLTHHGRSIKFVVRIMRLARDPAAGVRPRTDQAPRGLMGPASLGVALWAGIWLDLGCRTLVFAASAQTCSINGGASAMTGLTSELRWNGLGPQPEQGQPAVLVALKWWMPRSRETSRRRARNRW